MMAVFTVEETPDERGRIRALSLLHAASDALRSILDSVDEMDESTKNVCLELYECVEQEARDLFEPLQLIDIPQESKLMQNAPKKNFWDTMTPMRRKRGRTQHQNDVNSGEQNPTALLQLI
jgi:hypothetical protein